MNNLCKNILTLRIKRFARNASIANVIIILLLLAIHATGNASLESNAPFLNRISGFVFDKNRVPVSDIYVELQNELNQTLTRVRTDASGHYKFTGMTRGTYYINVLPGKTDFVEQSIRIEVSNFGPPGGSFGQSDDVTQDFYLQARKKPSDSDLNFTPGVIFAQSIPKDAESIYKDAVSTIKSSDFAEGERLLIKSLSIFPNYFMALNRLGYLYFEQKTYELAAENFAKAAEVNPKSEPTLFLLALSVYNTKQYDTTIEILRGALAYNHETARIYLLFGKAFRAKKNYQTAETALLKAEKLNIDKDPKIEWELATLYGNDLKKYGEAADRLEKFLKMQPDSQDKEMIKELIKTFREKDQAK